MKNNSYYTSFEKYQLNPSGRYVENKYLNNNSSYNNNMSFETQNNYIKRNNPEPYPTLVSKSNKNLKFTTNNTNTEKSNPSYNNFYRDYYETEVYQPYDYGTYEDYGYQTNWNMRPYGLYTQSTELKKNNEYKKNNNMYNAEEDSFQSNQKNHSYFESKYSKKKKPRILSNNINNYKNFSKTINPNQSNIISNISLNKNINKNIIINKTGSNKYIINNSPTTKRTNEAFFYNLPNNNNKVNMSVNSESDNKKNLTIKNTSLKNDINRLKQINNRTTIPSVIQPRTPSLYSHHTIHSPLQKLEDESYIPNNQKIYYNKTERNVPSKSLEKMAFRKLVFNYQNTLNNIKTNELDLNGPNLAESESYQFKVGKIPNTPKQFRMKNLTNIYKNVNEENKMPNNNITINIKNGNENINNSRNNNLNTEPNTSKNQIEITSKQSNKVKDDKNIPKENNENKAIKPPIKEIQIINSKKNNPSKNIVISKNKINNNNLIQNKKPITTNNKILPIKPKFYKNEKIIHDNNEDEPTIQSKYTFEIKPKHDNKEMTSNKSLNFINIPKGNNEQDLNMNKRYSHAIPKSEIKKAFKNEIIDFNNSKNNNNKIAQTISGISNLNNIDKDNKIKSQEVKTNKLTTNNNIINNNIISNSKKNNKEEISKTEKKNISDISKKNINILNTIPVKNLNQVEITVNSIPIINTTKDSLSLLNKK